MSYPWMILPPPRTVPEDVVLHSMIGNIAELFLISGNPNCAQSAVD